MPHTVHPQTPKTTTSRRTAQNTAIDFIGKSGAREKKSKTELLDRPVRKRGQRTWTPEQKAAQAAKMLRWMPWKRSTGPKTAAGKAISRYNACHGAPPTEFERRIRVYMRGQKRFLRGVEAYTRLFRAAHDPAVRVAVKDRLDAMHKSLLREAIILHLILPSQGEILGQSPSQAPLLSSPGLTGGSMDSPPSRGMTGESVAHQGSFNKNPLRSSRSFASLRERPSHAARSIFLAKNPQIPVYPPP